MGNLGHRLGSDYNGEKPNSIRSLTSSWIDQTKKGFKYFEFDLVETADKKLMVIHNRELDNGLKVKEFTFSELLAHEPWRSSLQGLLKEFVKLNGAKFMGMELNKPLMVELKRIDTTMGRRSLINQIVKFRKDINNIVPIQCICFGGKGFFGINHFEKCFPKKDREFWKEEFAKSKINVLNIYNKKKDLFKNPIYTEANVNYGYKGVKPIEIKKPSFFKRIINFFRGLF